MYKISKQESDKMTTQMLEITMEFSKIKGERDVYKKLYEDLIKQRNND